MLEPSQPRLRRVLAGIVGSCAAIALTFGPVAAVGTQLTGPSSSADPYIEPLADGVVVESLLTVGDSVGGYRMVGIPDGLGAQPNGNGTFSLYMNHEIRSTRERSAATGRTAPSSPSGRSAPAATRCSPART